MVSQDKAAMPPEQADSSQPSLDNVLTEHDRALTDYHASALVRMSEVTTQSLSPELQHVVQILCDTYEAIDLRIETTLADAERTFLAAMPEIAGYEVALRALVAHLINDLRATAGINAEQPLLLRFTYQDKSDLVEQLLSSSQARLVVVPSQETVSLHATIKGVSK